MSGQQDTASLAEERRRTLAIWLYFLWKPLHTSVLWFCCARILRRHLFTWLCLIVYFNCFIWVSSYTEEGLQSTLDTRYPTIWPTIGNKMETQTAGVKALAAWILELILTLKFETIMAIPCCAVEKHIASTTATETAYNNSAMCHSVIGIITYSYSHCL